MNDARSVSLALREVRGPLGPMGDDDELVVMEFVRAHLQAGTPNEVVIPLGRLLLLSRRKAPSWAFFESIDALYGVKMTTPGFAMTVPEPLRVQTARLLWQVRRRLRQFYFYPFLTLPLIVAVLVALAFFASPVAVTVAVAVGMATFAATAITAQLVNQHIKELDEISHTLQPALPSALQSARPVGALS